MVTNNSFVILAYNTQLNEDHGGGDSFAEFAALLKDYSHSSLYFIVRKWWCFCKSNIL
jgi:hypothetical protein